MVEKNRSERGQALVLLVLGIIALLGFTALAIDGGNLYSDRRHAQNAADTSSLTGARAVAVYFQTQATNYETFTCSEPWVSTAEQEGDQAAIARAATNGFNIDDDYDPDNHGVETRCVDDVELFPGLVDKYFDTDTYITADTQTSFAQFIFGGPLRSTVHAVARVRPTIPFALGNAIVSLNDAGCSGNQNGVVFAGSSDVDINGGGVFSNGCLSGDGNNFDVDIQNGTILYADEATGGGTGGLNDNMNPDPESVSSTLPDFALALPPPDCSGLPDRGSVNVTGSGTTTIDYGVYDEIRMTSSNARLVMNRGLYCLTGSPTAMNINGGELEGIGVTIFVENGGVDISGNVDPVYLAAPGPNSVPATNGAMEGILFYLAEGNTSTVSLTGNNNSFYLGTIYAPDGNIVLTGANDTNPTFNTQSVGWNVEVSGNAVIDINYAGGENYQIPPSMELQK